MGVLFDIGQAGMHMIYYESVVNVNTWSRLACMSVFALGNLSRRSKQPDRADYDK